MRPAPRLKYGNSPVTLGDLRFASKAEAKRYGELLLLQRIGAVSNVVVHPRYPLIVNGASVGTYIGDFAYYEGKTLVVEDVKSPATKTSTYKLKKKLMKAVHGIEIKEVMT